MDAPSRKRDADNSPEPPTSEAAAHTGGIEGDGGATGAVNTGAIEQHSPQTTLQLEQIHSPHPLTPDEQVSAEEPASRVVFAPYVPQVAEKPATPPVRHTQSDVDGSRVETTQITAPIEQVDTAPAPSPAEPVPGEPHAGFVPYVPMINGEEGVGGRVAYEDGEDEYALPVVAPEADLARVRVSRQWSAAVFLLTLIAYVIFVPHFLKFSSPPTGDQPFYLMMTISLVQDGDLNLRNNHDNRDEDKFYSLAPHSPNFIGMSAPYPLPPQLANNTVRPPDEWYNSHWPGLSIAMAPAWVIGGLFSLWWPATIVFMCIVGALVALNIFLFAYEQTGVLWIAIAVWAALAFANPIMTYSYMIFSELPAGLLLIYALRRLALGWGANNPLRLFLIGACIGFIPWLAFRCIPLSVMLGLYAAIQWWRYYRAHRTPAHVENREDGARLSGPVKQVAQAAWLLAPVLVSAVLLTWYNVFLYGRVVPEDRVPELGNVPIFHWPWLSGPDLTYFTQSFYGFMFDRLFGLFTYAPVYLLAVVGFIAMFQSSRRADRRLFLAIWLVILPYLFLMISFHYWNGLWGPPARYMTTMVPVFAAPLAMALFACRNWFFRGMYVVLALTSFGLMAIMLADPRRMWPGNPVFEWLRGYLDPYLGGVPSLPITVDLWNFFPGIDPRDDRNMTPASGWLTVVALGILLISYVAMKWEHRMRDRQTRHLPLVAQGGLWAAAILVVGATWYTANFDYLQHKTVLTEVGRTGANPSFAAPRGMDVAGDKLSVADFEAMALGVFKLPAGGFQRLAATTPQGPIEYAQPGAVKVGKDGSIYLLNNGPNEDALLVMSPDGQVIRKVPLNGKTQVAAGLAFDQDGFLLVADVIGGKIWKYGPEGGEPIAAYGGKTGGFNNILGITVAEDGKIYAAESSNSTVQELDPDGNYLRSFDVGCSPFYVAAHGGWLDVTCPNLGIKSINLATGNIQRSTGPGNSPLPTNVVGITYGPDGTLYVLDGSQLVTYKVEH